MIAQDLISASNAAARAGLKADYDALGEHLDRRGIDIAAIKSRVAQSGVALPSLGRRNRRNPLRALPRPGEPRNVFDKLDDCGGDPPADPRHAGRVAAHPVGQG